MLDLVPDVRLPGRPLGLLVSVEGQADRRVPDGVGRDLQALRVDRGHRLRERLRLPYDDADPVFTHTGNWIAQTNVSGAYKNTLHISSTIGDFVQLSFYGQKIRLTYQAGPSLGTVAIRIDSTDFVLDQSADESQSMEWESPVLTLANHQITITHISGGSINLDSLVVIDIATPTPTFTPPP